jgi:hypothetical protein
VAKVRRRWATRDLVLKWTTLSRERRERVLAELEETSRELRERDPVLASDLTAGVDVLDTDDSAPLLDLLVQAQADIQFLLALNLPSENDRQPLGGPPRAQV